MKSQRSVSSSANPCCHVTCQRSEVRPPSSDLSTERWSALQETTPRYRGYRSFDYLEPHRDYKVFELAPEIGRVPEHDLGLTDAQREKVTRLLTEHMAISLHEHPKILPADVSQLRDYNRTGRNAFGFEGLARSGLTAVFDNFMNGTGCVTSEHAWKWDDVIYDIGLRFADLTKQDHVVLATTLERDLRGQTERPARPGGRAGGGHDDRERAGPDRHPLRLRRTPDGHRVQPGQHARLRSLRGPRRRADPLRAPRGGPDEQARHRHRHLALRRPDLAGHDRGQSGSGLHHPCRCPVGLGHLPDEAGRGDPGLRRTRRCDRHRSRTAHHPLGRPPAPLASSR